eukprot:CAMPEP_0181293762 /NCGR_PEP_ID=MMETSP1101-20121128/3235_1 /TAXON_ID=46948 /ORGANISM="Rhodomonas abbreviata, Strain Caron Lab Isolate" /LENGTH=170 /DNA_ID=CAMNT_0023398365 /DNA_START=377 /DNA_END=885 /DNA_ORIENTATION=-
MLSVMVWSLGDEVHKDGLPYWGIYLTHWTLVLQVLFCLMAAVGTHQAIQQRSKAPASDTFAPAEANEFAPCDSATERGSSTPFTIRVLFSLHGLVLPFAFMVAILFWVLLYAPNPFTIQPLMVAVHGVNALVALFDTCIGALPLRLPHFRASLLYAVVYSLFSLFYYLTG